MRPFARTGVPAWLTLNSIFTVLVFTATLFLSASLLFLVQPMFAKMALPLFGGSPAVWNTSMLFFQAALLAGYIYAHGIALHLPPKGQVALHVGLLLAAALALPVALPAGWTPSTTNYPGLVLAGAMTLTVGVPFVMVSATAPLLQSWFARARIAGFEDPYFLYAASNLGSLGALLAYPIVIEPRLELHDQATAWSAGFILAVALVATCGIITLRTGGGSTQAAPATPSPAEAYLSAAELLKRRLHWVALAFVPSSLFLGTTTYITTDVAAVPLLWVLPLALYLLSFVITFAAPPLLPHRWVLYATPYFVVLFLVARTASSASLLFVLGPHLVLLFVLALMCHGELARYRPPSARLTEFYLLVSVGGVLGGVFNAIVAPLIFSEVYEYPLAIMFACLLLPGVVRQRHFGAAAIAGIAMLAAALALEYVSRETMGWVKLFGLPVLAVVAFAWKDQPLRFGLAAGALLAAPFIGQTFDGARLEQTRSFFGIYTVREDKSARFHIMINGTTLHGAQYIDPARQTEPLAYYWSKGPIGQLFASIAPTSIREVGMIGLGSGAISCYRRPGQTWTFFEINPAIIEMVRTGRHFTFVKTCTPDAKFIPGDARLSLNAEPPHRYDMLIFDAFSSDAIPVHLLTREAFTLYADKLAENGILVVHVSNRYIDIASLVANLGAEKGMKALSQRYPPTKAELEQGAAPSEWVVLSRNSEVIARLGADARWQEIVANPKFPVWTDSYSNVLGVLTWKPRISTGPQLQ